MEEAIKFSDVYFSYGDDEESAALSGVSFSVAKGEFVALVGHNGSGKSTIAKLTNGLLTPTKGDITVYGMDVRDDSVKREIRRKVGMVFQNPDNQMVAGIVEDDVAFGPENVGMPREEIVRTVEWALKSVGMYEYRERTSHKLSGGQKQRIAIAGVLAIKPDILVLDESTAMLDPIGRKEVMSVVEKLRRENGLTVVSITHFMDEVTEADRVIVLDSGKVAMTGTPVEIFRRSETLGKIGLEPPRAVALSDKLRGAGIPVSDDVTDAVRLGDELCRLL